VRRQSEAATALWIVLRAVHQKRGRRFALPANSRYAAGTAPRMKKDESDQPSLCSLLKPLRGRRLFLFQSVKLS
jgi:hypothetical protein